ncbi:MAG: hypothetical protein K2Y20_09215 [Sphingomonas sp.]|nr:hypothetical protein [Sphingomonas sp.]
MALTSAMPDEREEDMVGWFVHNFEPQLGENDETLNTAEVTEPLFVLEEAFPGINKSEIIDAAQQIVDRFETKYFGPAAWRQVDVEGIDRDDDAVYAAAVRLDSGKSPFADVPMRIVNPSDDPGLRSIVETILTPRKMFPWTVHATFIPGTTNGYLGEEIFDQPDPSFSYGRDDYTFESLTNLVSTLFTLELNRVTRESDPQEAELLLASRGWIDDLTSDAELFVDDAIIVHSSPPEWLPLSKLFPKGGNVDAGVAAVAIYHDPNQALGLLLAYGGARLFLRLVSNLNRTQDALFERISHRIHPAALEDKTNDLPPAARS